MQYLIRNKILAQQHYIPIYKFNIYNKKKIKFVGAESYYKNSISIPLYVGLKIKTQERIIKIIKNYFK